MEIVAKPGLLQEQETNPTAPSCPQAITPHRTHKRSGQRVGKQDQIKPKTQTIFVCHILKWQIIRLFLTFRKKLKAKKTQAEKKLKQIFQKNSSKLFENSIFCQLE